MPNLNNLYININYIRDYFINIIINHIFKDLQFFKNIL